MLGLGAAAGLRDYGAEVVVVVEATDRMMPHQLDAGAAAILRSELETLGIPSVTGSGVATIWQDRVRLHNGADVPARLVVIAAGIKPETTLARAAAIETRVGTPRRRRDTDERTGRAHRTCTRSASAQSIAARSTACGSRSPSGRGWLAPHSWETRAASTAP